MKPSLVEWKPTMEIDTTGLLSTLKPSLVEWKPAKQAVLGEDAILLETFLSGMETAVAVTSAFFFEVP